MAKGGKDRASGPDPELARQLAAAFAHPLLVKLLNALALDSPLAVATLSARVGEPPHKVRRHLNSLLSSGLVHVVREEKCRGSVRRYFAIKRDPRFDAEEVALLSERDRRRSAIGNIRLIFDEATRAASNPDLGERPDVVLTNHSCRVDERGWRELSDIHQETLDRVIRMVAESRERLESGDEKPIGIVSSQILLEAPQHTPETGTLGATVDTGRDTPPPRPSGNRPPVNGRPTTPIVQTDDGRGGHWDVERASRLARAIAHPLRARLLIVLGLDSPLGADVIARRLEESPDRVRRHLNTLAAAGIVDAGDEEGRRGGGRRNYALAGLILLNTEQNVLISNRDRRRASIGMIRVIFEEATRAASNPRLGERHNQVLAHVPNRVDERGWRELSELHHETVNQVTRTVAESRERLETGEEKPIGIVSDQILLEVPQHAIVT